MALTPETFGQFGGLRLDLSPDEAGANQAIDLLDVDWGTGDGNIRTREGAFVRTASPGVEPYSSVFHVGSGFLALRAATLAYIVNGVEKTTIGTGGGHLSFARMGTPSASYTYIAGPGNFVKRFDGGAFASPTATVDGVGGKSMPVAFYITVWPEGGNRLIVAGTGTKEGPGEATSSPSHVWFSEPGNAEGWESTAYAQLQPGDGEEIVGCAYWGAQVFVFKRTRAYVFYAEDTDEAGKPVFRFRSIDLGTELEPPDRDGNERVVAAAEGVYFTSRDGVWLTTGGTPVQIASDLRALSFPAGLVGPAGTTFGELRFEDALGIYHHRGRLYIPLGSGHSASRVLIYDVQEARWLVWGCALKALSGKAEELIFSGSGATGNHVYQFHHLDPEDASVGMQPRWQSGFYNLGTEDEKALTQAKLWGSGEVNVATAKDFEAVGKDKTFVLGTAPEVKSAQHQRTQNGVLHSHRFSGEGPWSVQRFTRYLQEDRVPDAETK